MSNVNDLLTQALALVDEDRRGELAPPSKVIVLAAALARIDSLTRQWSNNSSIGGADLHRARWIRLGSIARDGLVNEDQDGELNDIELPRALESAALLVCTGRADVADLVEIASRHAHAVCVLELRAMAAALEQSAAADWPDEGPVPPTSTEVLAAFDDGLLSAADQLRCRAAVLENEGVKP